MTATATLEAREPADRARTAGDPDRLIRTLVRSHRPALLARAVRLTGGDHAWAEDAVQETFIRAWRHLDRMTDEHGSVRGWLMRVTHNVVMNGHRARQAQPAEPGELETDLDVVDDISDQVLSAMLVDDALAKLTDGHREVIEQTYLQDKTMADAARDLDLPVGTIKSRVFYALRQLRAEMAPRTHTCATSAPGGVSPQVPDRSRRHLPDN
jgi:RNA polymerase sigma-70 factor, ECF subfamily